MNLSQRKLNRAEWNSVEIPVSLDEKAVINMICRGYNEPNYVHNPTKTIMNFLKIENTETNEKYIYQYYLHDKILKLTKKYDINYTHNVNINKKKLNKANMMRIENNSKEVLKLDTEIYEFTLLDIMSKLLKYKQSNNHKWSVHYYTLARLSKYELYNVNDVFMCFVNHILALYVDDIELLAIIAKGKDYIECNEYLLKYAPNRLYTHQKEIMQIFKKNGMYADRSKLVMYTAPTATGKTLTPIALAQEYRVIFVCAARHVGVALAKSSISVGKKIAFAFGCETADDIRLHYFAAKTYERNRKSGGIQKVDNSDGVNVEIMICDIKSYLCAMRYMCSFNEELSQTNKDLLVFWDEPTITLDYKEHECHSYITNIWRENEIPNIVLSSATLPTVEELHDTVDDFRSKFENPSIHTISSKECKKSIRLTDSTGEVVVPHLRYRSYDQLKECIQHISVNTTLYRYLDLHELCRFIVHVLDDDEDIELPEEFDIDNYFDSIDAIDMESIKHYYFQILKHFPSDKWEATYDRFQKMEKEKLPVNQYFSKQSNGMNITTCDAFTLTDGPTIFIAEDVEKIAKFCIQQSKMSQQTMSTINQDILFNNNINDQILKLNKSLENIIQKDIDSGNEKRLQKESNSSDVKEIRRRIDDLNALYREVTIDKLYVPNSLPHLQKWYDTSAHNVFTSNISNSDVQRIVELSTVDDIWKILLLMGIGLFSKEQPIEYTEIVKEFADNQKLYLIIANGDYIYGTNYQFCHAFIGKDLDNMTQEKLIQAIGRVGRNKLQQTYTVRLRNNEMINKIFLPEHEKIEAVNMNRLFCS